MLSNDTFLETRIQRLLDGLFLSKKTVRARAAHAQNEKLYTLAEILSKILVKKTKENRGPFLRSLSDKLTIWCQLNFY